MPRSSPRGSARPSGPVCANELLKDLDRFHAKAMLENTNRSTSAPPRRTTQGYASDVKDMTGTDITSSEDELSYMPASGVAARMLDQGNKKLAPEETNDLQAMSMCRYALTLIMMVIVGIIIGVVACCYFVAVEHSGFTDLTTISKPPSSLRPLRRSSSIDY